ncbi:NYN domain-containing protein [Terrabacter ginsenosidimutans]|uniref:NYN domain-containing protein n=1 Tax=Terrabacter ginsenosidimutans TaxID=490575 RepID=A0ABP7EMJ0_9MICO
MTPVRAALYLDFDNVFSGLLQLDPEAAIQFAEEPRLWLDRLTSSLTVDGDRRWLVLRCYMNPAGWVPHPDTGASGPRLYFSRFRPSFTRAGFDVVDCPRLAHTKNGADIRMVVDAMDTLSMTSPYDEFVIASGDADMTALLVRLRAADRRTTIVSPSDAADAFTAIADRLVTGQDVLELLQAEPNVDQPVLPEEASADAGESPPSPRPSDSAALEQPFEAFGSMVRDRYSQALRPLNLASLAGEVRTELGPWITRTGWFGAGSFVRAVELLDLPHLRLSQHWLWDASRHEAPEGLTETQGLQATLPQPVSKVSAVLNLPRLPQSSWRPLYRVLADYAGTHHFNLTEATRWSRDRLAEQGVDVSRNAVAFVARGSSYGGCPVYRQPAPSAEEISAAFTNNVLRRAEAAAMELTAEESDVIQAWLSGEPEMVPRISETPGFRT